MAFVIGAFCRCYWNWKAVTAVEIVIVMDDLFERRRLSPEHIGGKFNEPKREKEYFGAET